MMEWVSPTYLPSIEISAPAGVEVKWHFAVRGPSCRTTAGARSSTRFAGFAISEPGCEAGVAAGAPAVETRAYDCLTSLPFEFRYQTANPRCSLWASNASPAGRETHLDHRESTMQEMVNEFPLPSRTSIVLQTFAVLLWLQ